MGIEKSKVLVYCMIKMILVMGLYVNSALFVKRGDSIHCKRI